MYTKVQLDYLYSLLMDESNNIFSLTNDHILQYLGITKSRKFINPLKEEFYVLYDKDTLLKFLRSKQAIYRNKIRNSVKRVYSEESKERMRVSRKMFWNSIKDTDREAELKLISKNSMKKINELRLNQTEDAKSSRVKTRKEKYDFWHSEVTKNKIGNSQIGKVVSDETRSRQSLAAKNVPKLNRRADHNSSKRLEVRNKISDSIKYLHRIGKYPLKVKSKGHAEIETIVINLGYRVVSEYRLGRYSYDIYIPEINVILEFHGTYWHLDPGIYEADFYDKSKNRTATEQWERDDIKKSHAISNGYKFFTIWQREWECLNEEQKISKIKNIIC
jgi:hypothetical protein